MDKLLNLKIKDEILFFINYLFILFIGYVDHIMPPNISLAAFYMIPLFYFSWKSNEKILTAVCILTALISADFLYADFSARTSAISTNIITFFTNLILYLPVSLFVSKFKKIYFLEKDCARIDFVTGILNRNGFFENLTREIERSKRITQYLTIAYIDCDNFKSLNDTCGHSAGDDALKTVADTLSLNIRKYDLAARLGGDEFAVVIVNAGIKEAHNVIKKLNQLLLDKMKTKSYPVTFSIGAVTFLKPPPNISEMIELSDSIMYEVKKENKNGIKHKVFFNDQNMVEMEKPENHGNQGTLFAHEKP